MARTQEIELSNDRNTCPLLSPPPELRNTVYNYVVYSKYALPQFQWDEEHNSPELNLMHAKPRSPSNELLRTCRSIYDESKGVFLKAQREFWSDTTFTLKLVVNPLLCSFRYLESLLDEQANHMTRVNIYIDSQTPLTVLLRSGPEVGDSVTCCAAASLCGHRSVLPAPLNFIQSVVAKEQSRGRLGYRDVSDILWFESRGPSRSSVFLCVNHHPEPVVFSVRDLSRAGLMAVVARACGAPM